MSLRFWSVLAAAALAASIQATARASVIFDNTGFNIAGITLTSSPQLGGEVTAPTAGPWNVTELDLGFTSQNRAATADIQAFLYANNGTAGAPGTLLWSSPIMTDVAVDSFNDLIAFSVPSVAVPSTFTFTGAITNLSEFPVGFTPTNAGANTGTFVDPWVGKPGDWSTLPPVFEIEGRVDATAAVPEPATVALCLMGAGALALTRRRRTA